MTATTMGEKLPSRSTPAAIACVGTMILDVLGRHIDELPVVQRSVLVDEIRMTVAGTAGGTAVDLARLGASVSAVGAVGDDNAGRFVRTLLEAEGVDVTDLVVKDDTPTSASILPISSAGVRPAWHLAGANYELSPMDIPTERLTTMDAVHYGGFSALPGLDGAGSLDLLRVVHDAGVLTTADCLGIKRPDALDVIAPSLPHVDVFMPNRDEVALLTGRADVAEGARMLRDLGARVVIVKMDAEGCYVLSEDEEFSLPVIEVDVVDSTGCGDAFCAGVITGLVAGWGLRDAARLGTATGAQTAAGLGSDAGIVDLDDALAFMTAGEMRARV